MITERIKREIDDLQRALAGKDVSAVNDIVRYYYKWLDDRQKDRYLLNNQREQRSYDNKMCKYDRLISRSINELHAFVKAEIDHFPNSKSKMVFLAVVETLISLEKINFPLADSQKLRKNLLKFLSIAKDEEGGAFQWVCNILSLPDPEFVNRGGKVDTAVTLFGRNLADEEFLKKLIKISFGKNYSALKNFSAVKIPDDNDGKMACTIEHKRKKCEQFIPSTATYFIAFPFNRQDIEDQIIKACDEKFKPLKGVIARKSYESRTALCQICQMVLSARFGIYVLTKYSKGEKNEYFPNPNVMLELGLAMGVKKPTVILVEKDTHIPADLHGYLRIPFDNAENLPTTINEWDFSNFYDEANR